MAEVIATEEEAYKAFNSGQVIQPADTCSCFDARTCALICVMDGSLITGLRTGAAGAVSVKSLARKNARTITSIGTGNQARMQIRAIREVMTIEAIHAWNHNPRTLARHKADIEREFGIPVVMAASKQDAVESTPRSARSCWARSRGERTMTRSRSSTRPGWQSRTTRRRT